jgi:hypothetical protein
MQAQMYAVKGSTLSEICGTDGCDADIVQQVTDRM